MTGKQEWGDAEVYFEDKESLCMIDFAKLIRTSKLPWLCRAFVEKHQEVI